MSQKLKPDTAPDAAAAWYREVIANGVNPMLPGLYEWRIEGIGVYIGQYTRATRPRREYANNVANKLAGRPYRKGKPAAFRAIHIQLADAVRDNVQVTLTLIENCIVKDDRNLRERELINQRRLEEVAGGLRVINSN